jgi:hypothetical protein
MSSDLRIIRVIRDIRGLSRSNDAASSFPARIHRTQSPPCYNAWTYVAPPQRLSSVLLGPEAME